MQGWSTVETTNEIFPGDASHPSAPYGLGVRVPLMVVSPWSKGGWVNSQVFDHTSLIRFLEARFANEHPDLIETNITPWRRAVAGDLTTAFDFKTPNAWRHIKLPSTEAYEPQDFLRHPTLWSFRPPIKSCPSRSQACVRRARYRTHCTPHGGVDTSGHSFRIDDEEHGKPASGRDPGRRRSPQRRGDPSGVGQRMSTSAVPTFSSRSTLHV
jgi:phospholipase C